MNNATLAVIAMSILVCGSVVLILVVGSQSRQTIEMPSQSITSSTKSYTANFKPEVKQNNTISTDGELEEKPKYNKPAYRFQVVPDYSEGCTNIPNKIGSIWWYHIHCRQD